MLMSYSLIPVLFVFRDAKDFIFIETPAFWKTFTIHLIIQKIPPWKAGSKAATKLSKRAKTKLTRFLANKTDYLTIFILHP
jgi:hypothetical protein